MEDQRWILTEDLSPFDLADEDRVVSPGKYFGDTTFEVGHAIIQNWRTCLSRMVWVAHQASGIIGIPTGESP